MKKLKTAIVGARGYTGKELISLLAVHPYVEIVSLFASQRLKEKIPVWEEFYSLKGVVDLYFEPFSEDKIRDDLDVVFLNVPHKVAMNYVPAFLDKGIRVVDLSADFRIKDKATYEKWYDTEHVCPDYIEKAVYGLSEIYEDQIADCDFVANPGCYPTGISLGLIPLLKNKLIDGNSIIIDSKSGVSGAGKKESLPFSYVECNETLKAYRVANHQHIPEIEQTLSDNAGEEIKITFTPHLVPLSQGMLNTMYASLVEDVTVEQILDIYEDFYKDSFFVRVLAKGSFPEVKNVRGLNFCDIGIAVDERTGRVVVVSAIDNLIKGASGQALQNMNIMYGFRPEEGFVR